MSIEPSMDLIITLCLLAGAVGLFAYGRSVAARPVDIARVRMIPWNAVLVVLGLVIILLLVHLVNLFGIETGRR
jgi:hypothetical protein